MHFQSAYRRAHFNAASGASARAGFSLLELIIVLSVTTLLTSLLLPVLHQVRENAHRVISSSNLRQIGLGITMYARDSNDHLPYSELLMQNQPLELMAAHLGGNNGRSGWDGLGRLFSGNYITNPEIFYCPSHHGEHRFDRYQVDWVEEFNGTHRIYTNYHYCGHRAWDYLRTRKLIEGDGLVLATDGFRTLQDINHEDGMNVLRGDGSVRWRDDRSFFELRANAETQDDFLRLWRELGKLR